MNDIDILNDRELAHLEQSSDDDCDMASVKCVVREVRQLRAAVSQLTRERDEATAAADRLTRIALPEWERAVVEVAAERDTLRTLLGEALDVLDDMDWTRPEGLAEHQAKISALRQKANL